ncbi:MAG: peptidoglycan-binding domain-containing protein [Pyrinomonadaceae bacterium]
MFRKIVLCMFAVFSLTFAAFAQDTASTTKATTAASTSEEPKRAPIFRPNKDQIMQVQKILKTSKLYDGEADGKYNDETRTGIKSYQKDHGLKETGTLNRATLEAFKVELTDKQKLIPASPNSYVSASGNKTPKPKTTSSASTSGQSGETSSSPDKPKRTIFRATTDQIKSAQKLLKSKKMYEGEETGKLSDETREGLKKFQDGSGLKVTGTLNAVTLEKMGIALTDKQKADAAAAAAAPKSD